MSSPVALQMLSTDARWRFILVVITNRVNLEILDILEVVEIFLHYGLNDLSPGSILGPCSSAQGSHFGFWLSTFASFGE